MSNESDPKASNEASAASSTDGCPVQHSKSSLSSSSTSSWSAWLWSSNSRNDQEQPITFKEEASSSSCPKRDGTDSSPPASLEEAAAHAQTPQPDQRIPLNTHRQVSSIPRGDLAPHHQHDDGAQKWVYPSEQQLYNAMRRKGWQNVPEDSIPTVLQIHNHINERTWSQIQGWENTTNLTLTKFQGRPNDLSPKAFVLSKLLRLYEAPFDRHDWYVQNSNMPQPQRYVIDYYMIPSNDDNNAPPIPYVDARPALDHPRALAVRARGFLQQAFPGITKYIQKNWPKSSGED